MLDHAPPSIQIVALPAPENKQLRTSREVSDGDGKCSILHAAMKCLLQPRTPCLHGARHPRVELQAKRHYHSTSKQANHPQGHASPKQNEKVGRYAYIRLASSMGHRLGVLVSAAHQRSLALIVHNNQSRHRVLLVVLHHRHAAMPR